MADATELDYIRTFIGAVCTGSTVEHVVEHGKKTDSIIDATFQKILVKQGELIETYCNVYIKRFKILLSQPSEILLITTLNNLIDGINKFNKRLTIDSYTKPSTLIHIELVSCNEGSINYKSGKWDNQLILDVKFTTS